MGKSRMTVLDVKASVASLRNQLLGARVANVYDIDAKTYLLKCAKAGEKTMVLLESGIRFHSTDFMRDKSNMPSGFTLKLRKHIRTKRVEEVRQIGDDRVVAFTFGAGDEAVHLVLELFAGGNIILLNHENTIMVLLRTHTDEATGARTAVREMYPLNKAPEPRCITADLLLSAVEKTADNPKLSLKDGLSKELDYGPALVEHALLAAGVDPKFKAADMELAASSPDMVNMLRAFEAVDGIILGFSSIEVPREHSQGEKEQKQDKLRVQGSVCVYACADTHVWMPCGVVCKCVVKQVCLGMSDVGSQHKTGQDSPGGDHPKGCD